MKNSIKILAAIAMFGFAGNASAQNSATASGTANATVISPITLIPNGALNFGNFVGTVAGGTITVSDAGVINYGGDPGSQPGNQAGTISAQGWTVTGQAGYVVVISAPGGATMTGALTLTPNTPATPATLGVGGTYTFNQGGSILVPANEGAGSYAGSWTETVSYQ